MSDEDEEMSGSVYDRDSDSIDLDSAPEIVADVPEYVFDEGSARSAVILLERAYASNIDTWMVANFFEKNKDSASIVDQSLVSELVRALSYSLILEGLGRDGCSLGAYAGWPPPISGISPEVILLWTYLADNLQSPAGKARFFDLSFEARSKDSWRSASSAVKYYLESLGPVGRLELDDTKVLVRCWQIAKSFRIVLWLPSICEEMLSRVTAEMSLANDRPGCTLPMLSILTKECGSAGQPGGQNKETIWPVLEMAFEGYRRGNIATEVAGMMRSLLSEEDERKAVDQRELAVYVDIARKSSGLLRQHNLVEAIRVAKKRGLLDSARELTSDLQKASLDDLGMQTFETSIQIPLRVIEQYMSRFVSHPEWRQSFISAFLESDCPTGRLSDLNKQVEEAQSNFSFTNLFSAVHYTEEGLPRWSAEEAGNRIGHDLGFYARINAEYNGDFLASGLMRFRDRYGELSEKEVTAFICSLGCDDWELAEAFSHALSLFWDRDYISCVHLIVAKIETAARGVLRELDEGIYRIQVAKDPGGYPGLYGLLSSLDELGLDESWSYFLRWMLIDPAGPNIRNEAAHGLLVRIGPAYSALVLRAAALLISISPPPEESDGDRESKIRANLARPVRIPVNFPGRATTYGTIFGRTVARICIYIISRLQAIAAKYWS